MSMIRFRINGSQHDVKDAAKLIKEQFRIINESGTYKDRGKRDTYRLYLDCEIKEEEI